MQNPSRRHALAALAVFGVAGIRPNLAWAQSGAVKWPVATLKLMVPGPPGGAIDAMSRQTAERLAEHLAGASTIVDNKPGAGGLIGANWLMGAAADGGNFGVLNSGHLTMQATGAPNTTWHATSYR